MYIERERERNIFTLIDTHIDHNTPGLRVAAGGVHQEERAQVLGLVEAALGQREVALLQRHVAERLPLAWGGY